MIIGASQAYDSWSAPFAFSQYGMTVWSFCCPRLPAQALIYFAEEVRKRQPDAPLIVNLNIFSNLEPNDININWAANHWPYSLNKIKMINDLAEQAGYKGFGKLEFFLPITRFHSKWSNLSKFDYIRPENIYKGGLTVNHFFRNIDDLSLNYMITDEREELPQDQYKNLSEILDYCDANHIKVLFVAVPQALNTTIIKQINKWDYNTNSFKNQ